MKPELTLRQWNAEHRSVHLERECELPAREDGKHLDEVIAIKHFTTSTRKNWNNNNHC